MDQVGVKGAKHEEKWGPESVLKHETRSVNGDDNTAAVTESNIDGTHGHAIRLTCTFVRLDQLNGGTALVTHCNIGGVMLPAPNVHVPFVLNHTYAVSVWFVLAPESSSQSSGCLREVVLSTLADVYAQHFCRSGFQSSFCLRHPMLLFLRMNAEKGTATACEETLANADASV